MPRGSELQSRIESASDLQSLIKTRHRSKKEKKEREMRKQRQSELTK